MTEDADLSVVEIVVDPEHIWIVVDGRPVLGMAPETAAKVGPQLAAGAELYEKRFRARLATGNATVN